MIEKAKQWIKTQDWRALVSTPIGIAAVIGALWSVSHRLGLMSLIDRSNDEEDNSNKWHFRESLLLSAVVVGSLYFYKSKLVRMTPNLKQFEEPPPGARWAIVPENASIMLPGQEVITPPQNMTENFDARFLNGPPPF